MEEKERSISIRFPSGQVRLWLWEGTEDEESFPIRATKTKPYVLAYGIKYYLTPAEIKTMRMFIGL